MKQVLLDIRPELITKYQASTSYISEIIKLVYIVANQLHTTERRGNMENRFDRKAGVSNTYTCRRSSIFRVAQRRLITVYSNRIC